MNGIVIKIDPIALSFGFFELRWYSIFVVLGIIVAIIISIFEARRKGIPAEEIYSLAPWVLFGGIAGARLFHVIDRWEYYSSNLLQIFWLQQGGLAIWGALAGGGIAVIAYGMKRKLALGRLVDVLAPGLLTAQIIGRLGCIVNGDAYGGVTSLPWGFIYTHPYAVIPANLSGVPTHPYPVYEMLWNGLVLFFVLKQRDYFKRDGFLFLSYLILYSLGRFALTFFRQENVVLWGLQQAQLVALAIIIASVVMFIYLSWKGRQKVASENAP